MRKVDPLSSGGVVEGGNLIDLLVTLLLFVHSCHALQADHRHFGHLGRAQVWTVHLAALHYDLVVKARARAHKPLVVTGIHKVLLLQK